MAFLLTLTLLLLATDATAWGFYAHRRISRLAVFTLPPEMIGFFKKNIHYVTENAVNPDRRRYVVEGEACRHYIDLDVYGDSALYTMPRRWSEAVERYSADTLRAYGIVPWHVVRMKYWLTDAFARRDAEAILRVATDLSHYIADAHVPLHTTENYDGQLTGQRGIHGFWESRLPELFSDGYDYFVGPAAYVYSPTERIWAGVASAHHAVDSVLTLERRLTAEFGDDRKYSYETRGQATVKVYARAFAAAYHDRLDGQVARQMRASIKAIGDFWYTCWVDAGQPDLSNLSELDVLPPPPIAAPDTTIQARPHEH